MGAAEREVGGCGGRSGGGGGEVDEGVGREKV